MIKRKKRLCAVILTATLVMTGIQMPLGVQQVSAYTEDDAVEATLNDFESYYSRDLGQTENLLGTVSKEEKWNIDENGVITDTNSTWWNSGDELWKDMSVLKYNISQYKDFTLTVDFKNHIRGDYEEDGATPKDNWEMRYGAFVGFGIENNGSDITGWNGDNTGIIIKPYGTNSIKLAGSFEDINSGTHQSATQYDTTIDGVDVSNDNWHNMKLEVKDGRIKIYVDNCLAWPEQPLSVGDDYNGGYLFLASNNGGTQFKNVQIEEYNSEEGEPTNDFSKVSSYYTEDNATSDLRLAEPTDYWTETNTNAYFPRPGWQNGGNRVTSDRYLQSAAYGRLKNLTVGYTIPKNLTAKWGISRLRLYVTGENLLTITPLNDAFDPETLGGLTYPINRKVAIGLNLTL